MTESRRKEPWRRTGATQPLPFADRLSALCAIELSSAHGDAERIGAMIERLASSLAFTIAIAGNGDAKNMETLLQGAEAYLYECAGSHAKLGAFMATAKPTRGGRP